MRTYTIRPGDTFGAIAKRELTTVAILKNLNPQIPDINRISVGQVVNLPDMAATPQVITVPSPNLPVNNTSSSITPEQLHAIIPTLSLSRSTELCNPLNQSMQEFSINTPARQCAFLAQAAHESCGFSACVENLNYSADGLLKTFPKYFTSNIVAQYARNPQKIASRAYANRMGNGDEASSDGWRYRGRGFFQLTGKNNYQACSNALKVDFINHPELLEEPLNAFRSAGWYWTSRNLNPLADIGDFLGITRKINGGINGLDARKKYWAAAKSVLGVV